VNLQVYLFFSKTVSNLSLHLVELLLPVGVNGLPILLPKIQFKSNDIDSVAIPFWKFQA